MNFLWFKAAHIISVVAWFAGLFYLPRLMVYQSDLDHPSKTYDLFCLMSHRLYYWIMRPAFWSTLLFGTLLFFEMGGWTYYRALPWMHAKLGLLVFLVGYHHYLGRCLRQFKAGVRPYTARYYRIINEIPTFFLIAIVILVVCRPF